MGTGVDMGGILRQQQAQSFARATRRAVSERTSILRGEYACAEVELAFDSSRKTTSVQEGARREKTRENETPESMLFDLMGRPRRSCSARDKTLVAAFADREQCLCFAPKDLLLEFPEFRDIVQNMFGAPLFPEAKSEQGCRRKGRAPKWNPSLLARASAGI